MLALSGSHSLHLLSCKTAMCHHVEVLQHVYEGLEPDLFISICCSFLLLFTLVYEILNCVQVNLNISLYCFVANRLNLAHVFIDQRRAKANNRLV